MNEKLKVLDLFSGIGGFSLGLERTGGFETAAFCEIEPFCQKVLRKHWPEVPIYEDVTKLDGSEIDADVITGGYPCQPFSNAGKRRGEEDDRHLWPEMLRLIKAVQPRWVIAENVAGHINMGLDTVLSDLEKEGYTWWTLVIPACAVDAKHRRDRLWIVANSESIRHRPRGKAGNFHKADGRQVGKVSRQLGVTGLSIDDVADTECSAERPGLCEKESCRQRGRRPTNSSGQASIPDSSCSGSEERLASETRRGEGIAGKPFNDSDEAGRQTDKPRVARWAAEPPVGRVAHGIPARVDRLKCLGNAVVPQIPEMIGYAILEATY